MAVAVEAARVAIEHGVRQAAKVQLEREPRAAQVGDAAAAIHQQEDAEDEQHAALQEGRQRQRVPERRHEKRAEQPVPLPLEQCVVVALGDRVKGSHECVAADREAQQREEGPSEQARSTAPEDGEHCNAAGREAGMEDRQHQESVVPIGQLRWPEPAKAGEDLVLHRRQEGNQERVQEHADVRSEEEVDAEDAKQLGEPSPDGTTDECENGDLKCSCVPAKHQAANPRAHANVRGQPRRRRAEPRGRDEIN